MLGYAASLRLYRVLVCGYDYPEVSVIHLLARMETEAKVISKTLKVINNLVSDCIILKNNQVKMHLPN